MQCVVTGGCGFIGSRLVDRLIELGHEVTVLDDLSTGEQSNCNWRAELVIGSVADLSAADYSRARPLIGWKPRVVLFRRVVAEPFGDDAPRLAGAAQPAQRISLHGQPEPV